MSATLGRREAPGALLRASRGRVDVWQVELALDSSELAAAHRTLNAAERARAARLRVDAERWFAARAALRRILGRYLAREPEQVPIVIEAGGRPTLARAAGGDLRFSLSHAGDVALIAVRLGFDVGVDVEPIRDGVDGAAIARAVFPMKQRSALASGGEREAFFRDWVRHEALAKATGRGIAQPIGERDAARFSVRDLAGIAGHAAAIASEGTGWSVSCAGLGNHASPVTT